MERAKETVYKKLDELRPETSIEDYNEDSRRTMARMPF